MTATFGIYVDADNVSSQQCDLVIKQLASQGTIRFVKAYGNWQVKRGDWKEVCLKHGIISTHRFNHTNGKNSADISLVIDAVLDAQKSNLYNSIVVVSSDSDFMPLMRQATVFGKTTIGFGQSKASKIYSQTCDQFFYLEDLATSSMH